MMVKYAIIYFIYPSSNPLFSPLNLLVPSALTGIIYPGILLSGSDSIVLMILP